jgi:acetyl-CoA acetyltransferase
VGPGIAQGGERIAVAGDVGEPLVVGVEKMSDLPSMELTRNIGMAGDVFLDQAYGLTFPANYALLAQRHMQEYGSTVRDFELISLKNHENARLNPKAHFHHKRVTQRDIDGGPSVASPLRLFDCCPAWEGNGTADQFVVFAWEGPLEERLLIAVNFGPQQGQCYVQIPWNDARGNKLRLRDRLSTAWYDRAGDDLAERGLYLDMPAWQYHLFEVTGLSL